MRLEMRRSHSSSEIAPEQRSSEQSARSNLTPALASVILFVPFLIHVADELVLGDRAFEAVSGNIDFREPQNRIQDYFAVVIVAPIFMVVTAHILSAAGPLGTSTA